MTVERKFQVTIWVRNVLFLLTLVLGGYIYFLRREYDLSQQRSNTYKEQRNALVLRFDSLTVKNDSLEKAAVSQKDQNIILQHNYDSLKSEFYKKQNASTVTNRPILHYSVLELDSFWASYRFRHSN